MVKVNNKMLDRFIQIMDDYDEFIFFNDEEDIRRQLELVLNSQGYWSGCGIRVYYDEESEDFRVESRF